ncbi:head decoration protein [Leisingera caerulea]|uniref:head decoration protein n=1 Tax=Leisingera caerulea TaxID=506591 RepID=UPI0004035B68|nr:head decoration protein [Leisingera caerulea]
MNALTEGNTAGDFVAWEEDGFYSRDTGTIGAGNDYEPGSVLGEITASGKLVYWDPAAVDGSETVAAVLRTPAAAADADVPNAVLMKRHCRLKRHGLIFGPGVTTQAQRDQAVEELEALGMLAR